MKIQGIQDIQEVTPFLRAFPDPQQVFADPCERYSRHLHPLVSIDLKTLNPAWDRWIHVVHPLEPLEGYVGDETLPFHNYYLRPNWIGFHLDENSRYSLAGDFRYFYLENTPQDLPQTYDAAMREEMLEHYQEQQQSYDECKANFLKHGKLLDWYTKKPQNIIDQLGGYPGYGNWCSSIGDIPLAPGSSKEEDRILPLSEEGREFHFIAGLYSGYYRRMDPWILLFYEPVAQMAWLTFDWS